MALTVKFKLDKQTFELDPDTLTMGESFLLEESYGLTSFNMIDLFDVRPRVLGGIMHVAIKRKRPDTSDDDIKRLMESGESGQVFKSLTEQIEAIKKKLEAEQADRDPSPAVTVKPAGGGSKKPTRSTAGTPS